MSTHTDPPARRALALAALTGACLVAALGLATDQASADYTAQVQAGTLQLTGDAASDTLTLAQGTTANTVAVLVNGQLVSTFDRATFTAVAVDARGGNDTVNVQNMSSALENVTIDGGAGDDTLTGGNGAETFIGGAGNDFVDGNIGADTAQLGTGNDTFQWDPGDGSDTVDGQGGKDTLAFNGSNVGENIDVAANGSRVRLTRDVAGITMDLERHREHGRPHPRQRRHRHRRRPHRHRPRRHQRRPQRLRRQRRRRGRHRHRQRDRPGRRRHRRLERRQRGRLRPVRTRPVSGNEAGTRQR